MPNNMLTGLPPLVRGHALTLTARPLTATGQLPLRVVASMERPSGVIYTPFANPATLGLAIGTNMQRLAAGKMPLPLIARDNHACRLLKAMKEGCLKCLEEHRAANQQQLQIGGLSERTLNLEEQGKLQEKIQLHSRQIASLRRLQIVSNQHGAALAALTPADNKIYLLAHGRAGCTTLSMPAGPGRALRITAPQLARQLHLGQLRPDFHDFRLRSCFGADARTPRSFAPEDLDAAAQSHGKPGSSAQVQAFGQRLSNALSKAGFIDPHVTAYHGSGSILDTLDGHKRRRLFSQSVSDVRESSVGRVFKSEH